MNKICLLLISLILLGACSDQSSNNSNQQNVAAWIEAMQDIHELGQSKGVISGQVTQIGDSITYSMAFLSNMKYGKPSGSSWQALRDHIDGDLIHSRKGTAHANYSGWESADAAAVISSILAMHDSEIAILMLGTNDVLNDVSINSYETHMRNIVDACLDAGCMTIISTIPPSNAKPLSTIQAFNAVIKEIAHDNGLPLIDYYAAILERQSANDWDGTLISSDGIHPSNPSGSDLWDFSNSNLEINGYALRNYLTCLKMLEVIEQVINAPSAST